MASTMTLPPTFDTPETAVALVTACEADFESRLSGMAWEVSRACAEENVHILRLSGPTCAGKTTAARKLTEALEADGLTVYPISLDDFYYEQQVLLARSGDGTPDYDSAETLDMETLRQCIDRLLHTGRAQIPVYDFRTGTRKTHRTLNIPEGVRPVFLFEGIQAVYPQVTALLTGVPSRSVFIQVCRSVTVGEEVFLPHDLRLLRRLVRDAALRGADPSFTLSLWEGVRANEEAAILPFAGDCDFTIDTTMAYEVHMLAPHVRRVLTEHPVKGPEQARAEDIYRRVAAVEGIPSRLLPSNSLYREFIPVCMD
jgi:uridine kinase